MIYKTRDEAFKAFIKENWNDYLEADFDGHNFYVDRMYEDFLTEVAFESGFILKYEVSE